MDRRAGRGGAPRTLRRRRDDADSRGGLPWRQPGDRHWRDEQAWASLARRFDVDHPAVHADNADVRRHDRCCDRTAVKLGDQEAAGRRRRQARRRDRRLSRRQPTNGQGERHGGARRRPAQPQRRLDLEAKVDRRADPKSHRRPKQDPIPLGRDLRSQLARHRPWARKPPRTRDKTRRPPSARRGPSVRSRAGPFLRNLNVLA